MKTITAAADFLSLAHETHQDAAALIPGPNRKQTPGFSVYLRLNRKFLKGNPSSFLPIKFYQDTAVGNLELSSIPLK